jgi:hypothetical protein
MVVYDRTPAQAAGDRGKRASVVRVSRTFVERTVLSSPILTWELYELMIKSHG